jgi:lysophospholipase L1-like esterase
MVNRGIASDQVGDESRPSGRGVINRLHESVWQCRPIHVFVLIGVNDIGSGIKGERLEKRHGDLLNALMEGMPATSITLQTILPARGRFAKLNEAITDANRRLDRLAEERGIHVLDLHATMADEQGQLREDYTNDGLHLNARANEAWSQVLRQELQRLGHLSK